MTASSQAIGPWVRLQGLSISQLPKGGSGAKVARTTSTDDKIDDLPSKTAAPNLKQFITYVLSESIPFIDGVAPKSGVPATWKSRGSPKKYPASDAPVFLSERSILGRDIDKVDGTLKPSKNTINETWFCRRSCHRNVAVKGTASWTEFKHSFKDHHAETEEKYVSTVIGAREAITWETDGIEVEINGEKWSNIFMGVVEMKHRIDPKPLKNRTFPVLQVAASLEETDEFLVISIPINDFEKSPHAEYAQDKSLVVAAYASIERIRILPSSGEIEWIMATASDARGALPQWMQNLAVPGAIAKDVPMFLEWIQSQR